MKPIDNRTRKQYDFLLCAKRKQVVIVVLYVAESL